VVVEGVLLSRTYLESEVLHFELHNEKIQAVINGLYTAYAKLIEASRKHYLRQNARRGTLTIPTNYPETDKAQQDLRDLMEKRFKRFFDAEGDAVLPLANGLEYTELENKANTGTKGSQEGRDVRGFIDDIFDFVAIALNIPPQLVKGTVADTEKAMDNFLTFCINPLAELISDEVNRKYYGKRAFLERTYLRVNTSMIRSHDIKDIAGALETLLRIGAYSIDDILKVLGMEPLGTDWSTIRWVTKNYQPVTEVVKGTESG
jgi:HK97 family phage portal protein